MPGLRRILALFVPLLVTAGLVVTVLVAAELPASAASCPERTISSQSYLAVMSGDRRTLVQLRSTQIDRQPAVLVYVNSHYAGRYLIPQFFYSRTMLAYVKNERRLRTGTDGINRYQAVSTYKLQACNPWVII